MFRWLRRTGGALKKTTLFITKSVAGFGGWFALKCCEEGARELATCLAEEAAVRRFAEAADARMLTTVILDVTYAQDIQLLYVLLKDAGIIGCRVMETNLFPGYRRVMEINFPGRMIGECSTAGVYAMNSMYSYDASRSAVDAFLGYLQNEFRDPGIKVIKIMPAKQKTQGTKAFKDILDVGKRCWKAIINTRIRVYRSIVKHCRATSVKYKRFKRRLRVAKKAKKEFLFENPSGRYYQAKDARCMGNFMVVVLPLVYGLPVLKLLFGFT